MLIIFDLDGVLLDARNIHKEAFNKACEYWSDDVPTEEEHLRYLDGLPTQEKLKWMTENKGTPPDTWGIIYKRKQELTHEAIKTTVSSSLELTWTLTQLRADGHVLACVSNAIIKTVHLALDRLGITDFFSYVIGNDMVNLSKPHPEGFLRAMIATGFGPKETYIIEDSPKGREGALASGATLIPVNSPKDVTYKYINSQLSKTKEQSRWKSDWTIVIPMAGAGSRFQQAGYTFPKPLIDVDGKPMIQRVVESLGIDGNYVFIAQKEHDSQYNLTSLLKLIAPNCEVVLLDGMTGGAACSVLEAKDHIDLDKPVLIANSDQIIEWDYTSFAWNTENVDGMLPVFTATHPKWSFAKINKEGNIIEIAEKNPISNVATCGIYWWRSGELFLKSIDLMIHNNDRTNGEFYLAPAYNYLIQSGGIVRPWLVDRMHGLGTPEDLQVFLAK